MSRSKKTNTDIIESLKAEVRDLKSSLKSCHRQLRKLNVEPEKVEVEPDKPEPVTKCPKCKTGKTKTVDLGPKYLTTCSDCSYRKTSKI